MTFPITRIVLACVVALLGGCASMRGIAPQAQLRDANELASRKALEATATGSTECPKAHRW
jgi:hypothetical protein